jgi:ATP-binding protein involved in chromosome partitioning
MFRKVHVPLLGLVENMSYYCCPNCGHQDNIFGSGGVAAAADDLGVELLGQVRREAKRSCTLTRLSRAK